MRHIVRAAEQDNVFEIAGEIAIQVAPLKGLNIA
jgi:hypothetical protein